MRRILEAHEANAATGNHMSIGYLEATGEMLSQIMVRDRGREARHEHSGALHGGEKKEDRPSCDVERMKKQ